GPAAEIAGDQPEGRAERDGDAKDDRRQQEGDAIAEQHPGEDVAPDIVGAEPVSGGGRQVTGAEIDHRADMIRIGRDQGSEQRRGQDDDDDRRTDHRRRIAAEAMPVLVGGRDPGRRFPDRGGAHARAPRMRTLGSTTPTRRSMARLTRTKNRPEIITTPMTAFRSFCRMLRTPWLAMPGHEKTSSTTNALPSSEANSRPRIVRGGTKAGRSMYLNMRTQPGTPKARAASI